MDLVSIIVPIYNVEEYLRRSIESIISQTYKNIEIILVNDGSLDGCLLICKEYARIDSRIKIVDKPNGGVSSARNAGIINSTGKYIGFIDPDDWIEPEMFESMYNKIEKTKSDICMTNFVIEDDKNQYPIILDVSYDTLSRKDVLDSIIPGMISSPNLNSSSNAILGSVCRLLISKELVLSKAIIFNESIDMMEDLIFCLQVLIKSNRTCIDRGQYYHYMTNDNSAVRKYRKDAFHTYNSVFKNIEDILKEESVYQHFLENLDIRYVNMKINLIANEVHKNNIKKPVEKIRSIEKICNDDRLKKIIIATDMKGFTIRKKICLLAIKNQWSVYLYLYFSSIARIIQKN